MERLVKDTRFLEGLDITFKAEPVSIATYGEGDNATAVYRYHVHASDTKGEYPGSAGFSRWRPVWTPVFASPGSR